MSCFPCLEYRRRNLIFWGLIWNSVFNFYKWVFCITSYKFSNIITYWLFHLFGGESGIRTHDRVAPIHAFQACALNHSAISPKINHYPLFLKPQKRQSVVSRHYQIVSFFSFLFFAFQGVFSFCLHLLHKVLQLHLF